MKIFLSIGLFVTVGSVLALLGGQWEGNKVHINGAVVVMAFLISGWMSIRVLAHD